MQLESPAERCWLSDTVISLIIIRERTDGGGSRPPRTSAFGDTATAGRPTDVRRTPIGDSTDIRRTSDVDGRLPDVQQTSVGRLMDF